MSCLPLPGFGLGEGEGEGNGGEGEGEGEEGEGEGEEGEGEEGEGEEGEGEGEEGEGEGEGPRCGDGTVDADEVCDDANTTDGDGCNIDCAPSGRRLLTTTILRAFTTYAVDLGRAAISHDMVAVACNRFGDNAGDRVVLSSLLDESAVEVLFDHDGCIVRDIVAVDDGFLVVTSDFDDISEHVFHVDFDGTRSARLDVPREVFNSRALDDERLVAVRDDGAVVVERAAGTTVVGVHSLSAVSLLSDNYIAPSATTTSPHP
jgi:cysteine-rich repeat protein